MQEKILDALRRGDTPGALDLARAHAAEAPGDAEAQRLLALALRTSGDLEGARDVILAAIALAPDSAALHMEHATLQLGMRDLDAARQAMAAAAGADPNHFAAYAMRAHLALASGDIGEAERQLRLAERVDADHPELQALRGMVALRKGDGRAAIAQLSAASQRAPGDPLTLQALAFAYLEQEHFAFAEQAFRKLLDVPAVANDARLMLALMQARQGRPTDAIDELGPLLANEATATLQVRRFVGELELSAGRPDRALQHLREVFAAQPGELRTTTAIAEAWRRLGAADEARGMLDAALATSPGIDLLWHVRLVFDPVGEVAADLIERWRRQSPESMDALTAAMTLHALEGRMAETEAAARALLAIAPDHFDAEMKLVDALLVTDPAQALQRIETLLARDDLHADARATFELGLGLARHRVGDTAGALEHWNRRNAGGGPGRRLPRPPATPAPAEWPPAAAPVADAPPVVFMPGLPGALAERGARLLKVVPAFRDDRVGPNPPADIFQDVSSWSKIASGEFNAPAVIATWLKVLPARGIRDAVIDWVPWWDNTYTAVVRAALPGAQLLVMLRDPRDMLMDWIAFGAGTPFAAGSPQDAADWLAAALDQVALIHEQNLVPHRLLRVDEVADDPVAMAALLSSALGSNLPSPPSGLFGTPRFAAGDWRRYADQLAAPFAALAPVARRLGYPAA
ncbi:tetratricopeptide repeat protein [Luteimonas sp. MJ174]|uniref:tetratricopeptide repeat protein n=1 Tax=Luteimonas sp. MJ174 TaxID=3129237 RepID=UPI0031BBC29D